LNSRVNKRVDYLLTVLLKIEEHMFFEHQRKNLRWKHNQKEAKEELRHENGLTIPSNHIQVSYAHIHILIEVYISQWCEYVEVVRKKRCFVPTYMYICNTDVFNTTGMSRKQ